MPVQDRRCIKLFVCLKMRNFLGILGTQPALVQMNKQHFISGKFQLTVLVLMQVKPSERVKRLRIYLNGKMRILLEQKPK